MLCRVISSFNLFLLTGLPYSRYNSLQTIAVPSGSQSFLLTEKISATIQLECFYGAYLKSYTLTPVGAQVYMKIFIPCRTVDGILQVCSQASYVNVTLYDASLQVTITLAACMLSEFSSVRSSDWMKTPI